MKAVRVHAFGGPEVLVYEDVPLPSPGPGDVLVRVHAACLNPPDWYAREGYTIVPESIRPERPLPFTPGSDISGVVVAVGAGVESWQVGDEVFGLVRFPSLGDGGMGYAEYTTSPASHLARKPASLSHVEAAAVPMAGLTAYQYLFDHVGLERGRSVLVNGAAGGVGHFLVQLAKTQDAHVTAVASGRHRSFLASLGADEFIDYTTTGLSGAVDHVFDTVGGPSAYKLLEVVKPGGTVSPVFYGEYHREQAALLDITFPSGQVHSDGQQLEALARLLASGQIRVGIDSVYPLAEAPQAHKRAAAGHIQGKIVLQVEDS
ncbi:NADP-dependent oxidoreductase [Nonomuraea sp. NPDC050556]|uniref:NADP-dependent oxidoreductase n=1 Tax=Nonomuraea sp. NPDC050556 TaxID=3364369 RepID=UPI0037A016A3